MTMMICKAPASFGKTNDMTNTLRFIYESGVFFEPLAPHDHPEIFMGEHDGVRMNRERRRRELSNRK